MAEYWFKPKRYGYGAGLPTSWEGAALIAGFIAIVAAIGGLLPMLFEDKPLGALIAITIVVMLTVPFLIVCEKRTEGGWRWRWGGEK
jgi:VIT1/CCC1 family predicted Fe2+/Mn2+ transporter